MTRYAVRAIAKRPVAYSISDVGLSAVATVMRPISRAIISEMKPSTTVNYQETSYAHPHTPTHAVLVLITSAKEVSLFCLCQQDS